MSVMVSIIIPVYNKELYLEECIQSILNQKYNDFELILIDDQSTDKSYETCKKFAQMDSRIVCHQMIKNSGPGATRNYGISIARGRYIQFIDADDIVSEDMTAKLVYSYESENNIDIVICGYRIINDLYNSAVDLFESDSILDLEAFKSLIIKWRTDAFIGAPWNKLYRKDIIDTNSLTFPENQNWAEDFLFNLQYIKVCGRIRILSDVLYSVRRGIESLTIYHVKRMDLDKAYMERIAVISEYRKLKWNNLDQYNLIPQLVLMRLIRLAAVRGSSMKELFSLLNRIVREKNSEEYFSGTMSVYLTVNERRIFKLLKKRCFLTLIVYEKVRAVLSPVIKKLVNIT